MRSVIVRSALLALLSLPSLAQGGDLVHSIEPRLPGVTQPIEVSRHAGLRQFDSGQVLGVGADYLVRISGEEVRFMPALGEAAQQTRYVVLRPTYVRRGEQIVASGFAGEPRTEALRAWFERGPGISERFDVGVDGVELSWRFDRRPEGSGDLVVRYQLSTNLPLVAHGDDGLRFVDALGGVTIGGVTGVDARGERVRGDLSLAGGALELSLPAAFVDAASYPIVLDPLVGSEITVSYAATVERDPDVSYSSLGLQGFLVVWRKLISATESQPLGLRIDTTGGSVGGIIVLGQGGSNYTCGRPRVATWAGAGQFGVVYEEQPGVLNGIKLEIVSAGNGTITNSAVIASSSGVDLFDDPDIGGTDEPYGGTAFVVTYRDNIVNRIRARRVLIDPLGQLFSPSPTDLWTDVAGPIANTYSEPAISRQVGPGSDFLVVARRHSGIGPQRIVSGKLISSATLATVASTSFVSSSTDDVHAPDVDGANGRWTVAWEQEPLGGGSTSIRRRSVRYDGSAFVMAPTVTFGGTTLHEVTAPSLGWSFGRTWMGYHNFSGIGPQTSLRVAALDNASATSAGVELNVPTTTGDTRVAVATDASGGAQPGHGSWAMAAYAHGTVLYAQLMSDHDDTGTFVSLGGGCGLGGSQFFNHEPGVGSYLVCTVANLSPTALFTVFNLTSDLTPVVCGPCEWAPFSVTQALVPVATHASTGFVIPCLPTLVGTQYITQWTTFDPPQSACFVAPEFAMTDRSLMTLGN